MKKFVSVLMALTMVLSLAACGGNNDAANGDSETKVASALEILENTWAGYGDDEKFSVYGGNIEYHNEQMEKATEDNPYMPPNEPGNYDMAYAENLTYNLLIPAEQIASVDEAATMINSMLANNFTSGVVHLAEGVDVAAFTAAVHNAIMTNPWMCGFPEKELIAVVDGSYVLIAFGVNDAMTPFQNHFVSAYPAAEIVYNEDLV